MLRGALSATLVLVCLLQCQSLRLANKWMRSLATVVTAGSVYSASVPAAHSAPTADSPQSATVSLRRGMSSFYKGDVSTSVKEFDNAIAIDPKTKPYLWQRGISLYYVDDFERCGEQFRNDVLVNPSDTEEAVWSYMCDSRLKGMEYAKEHVLALKGTDPRPIMRQVYDVVRGAATKDDLRSLGDRSDSAGDSKGYFYSRLYLALLADSEGDATGSTAYIQEALNSNYGKTGRDYMVFVARVHGQVRGGDGVAIRAK